MAATIPTGNVPLSLSVVLNMTGLLGQDLEYAPQLKYYGTHRGQEVVRIVDVKPSNKKNPLVLNLGNIPGPGGLKGHENIVFEIMARTRFSGVAEIDAVEHDNVERRTHSGRCVVTLAELLHPDATAGIRCDLIDPALASFEMLTAVATPGFSDSALFATKPSDLQSYKGELWVRVNGLSMALLQRYATASVAATTTTAKLNFNTHTFVDKLERANVFYMEQYAKYFIAQHNGAAPLFGVNPALPEAANLHLALDRHQDGWRPAVYFFQSRTKHELRNYPLTSRSAHLLEASLVSSLAAFGISKEQFCAITSEQFRQRSEKVPRPEFLRCVAAAFYACAKPAHSVYYSMDITYRRSPSATVISEHPQEQQSQRRVGVSKRFARSAWYMGKYLGGGVETALKPAYTLTDDAMKNAQMLDRFGKDVLTGETNTGDCEDDAAITHNTYSTLRQVVATVRDASPFLRAVDNVLRLYVPFASGSMVTAAYFSDAKDKATAFDAKTATELPLKTSQTYRDADTGGHSHETFLPRAHVMNMLLVGKQFTVAECEHALGVRSVDMYPWESALPKGIGEGTGPVHPFTVLAAAEVHPVLAAEAASTRALKKHIVMEGSYPTLMETFRPLGTAFYSQRPAEAVRSTNTFFRMIKHLISPELFARDPRMAQFVVCDMRDRTRGVDAERLFRAGALDKDLALITPLGDVSKDYITNTLLPVWQCIDRQQPLNTSFRCRDDYHASSPSAQLPAFGQMMNHTGHGLSTAFLQQLSSLIETTGQSVDQVMNQHATTGFAVAAMPTDTATTTTSVIPASSALTMATVAGASLNTYVLPYFSRSWKLAKCNMSAVIRELEALKSAKKIENYVFWRDVSFAQCDDQVTLALVVKQQ